MQASERHGATPSRPSPARIEAVHPFWMTALLAVSHFVLFHLAFPPWNLWTATLVSIVPLALLAIGAASAKRAIMLVVLAGAIVWLVPNRWIRDVTPFGYPLLGAYLSIYPALFAVVLRAIWKSAMPWPMSLVVPVAWVALEFLRGAVAFDGYPWFLAGHPLVHVLPLVQVADLLGTYFVSFIAAMASGLCIDIVRARRASQHVRGAWISAAIFCSVIVLTLVYGAWRLSQIGEVTTAGPGVLAVQTNLPQSNKVEWSAEQQAIDIPEFIALTEAAVMAAKSGGQRVDLIVWPETMLPGFGLEPADLQMQISMHQLEYVELASQVLEMNQRQGIPVLIGSPVYVGLSTEQFERDGARLRRWTWREHYNSAYLVDGSPPYPRYDKLFLTPFGETMPYISQWPWLERQLLALGAGGMTFDLDRGKELRRLQLPWADTDLSIATPICFEDTVAPLCRRMIYDGGEKAAHMLLNLSNDGWFGADDGGRAQHLQIARFRCIENRVPMVRAVNTGFSASIDSTGRIELADRNGSGRPAARTPGSVAATVRLDSRSTLYGTVLGDMIGWVCIGATAVMLLAALRRHRLNKGMNS